MPCLNFGALHLILCYDDGASIKISSNAHGQKLLDVREAWFPDIVLFELIWI